MLGSMENIVSHAIDSATAKYDNLIFELKRTYEIIDTNKKSLSVQDEPKEDEPEIDEPEEDIME